jgi:tight adherence protein B
MTNYAGTAALAAMNKVIFVTLVVVALAALEAIYSFVRYFGQRRSEALRRRLRLAEVDPAAGPQVLRRRRFARTEALDQFLGNLGLLDRLQRLLEQTDLEITVAQLLFYMVALALAGLCAGLLLKNPLVAATLAPALGLAPLLLALSARDRRSRKISDQLPDALDMMARALRAGHALPSSFKLVAQECPMPIALEFARAYEQQNLGIPLEAAVVEMTRRVPQNLDLKLFAVSVNIQKETGGNLVEVLEGIAQTMRERFKFYSKLRALTAEGRLSAIILGALPFVVALALTALRPDYVQELTHDTGRYFLVAGIVMWSVGVVWLKTQTKVEY